MPKAKRSAFKGQQFQCTEQTVSCQNLDVLTFDHLNRPLLDDSADKITCNEAYFNEYCNKSKVLDLVDIKQLSGLLQDTLVCGQCKEKDCIDLAVQSRVGVAARFALSCTKCTFVRYFGNSTKQEYQLMDKKKSNVTATDESTVAESSDDESSDEESMEQDSMDQSIDQSIDQASNDRLKTVKLETINIQLVNAFRQAGVGYTGAKAVCTFMNMPNPPCKNIWIDTQEVLGVAFQKRADLSMRQAIEEAVLQEEAATQTKELMASTDGSWMKRGFKSNVGMTTTASVGMNKLIAIDVRHLKCSACNGKGDCPKGEHCDINHYGSSGGMESAGAKANIEKLYKQHKVKITKYLGDGDSRAFTAAKEVGKELGFDMSKYECKNHFSKRMGARLCNEAKNQKAGGKGKGKMNQKVAYKIQQYYSWILYRCIGNLELAVKRINGLFNHLAATDEDAHWRHKDCDPIFCKYMQAEASGTVADYKHAEHFHLLPEVMEKVKAAFTFMGKPENLKAVMHGKTQNVNESCHNIMWKFLPKSGFAHRTLVELAAHMMVSQYNEGKIAILDVLSFLGIEVGKEMADKALAMDRLRVGKKRKVEEDKLQRTKRVKATHQPDDGEYCKGMGPIN